MGKPKVRHEPPPRQVLFLCHAAHDGGTSSADCPAQVLQEVLAKIKETQGQKEKLVANWNDAGE
jgi:hypothetical protein